LKVIKKRLPTIEKGSGRRKAALARVARWHIYFHTKNSNFGIYIVEGKWKFLEYLLCVHLVYFVAICGDLLRFVAICGDILWRFGMFVMIWNIWGLLVYFSQFWYIYSAKKKSGNPGIAEKTSVEHKWTNVEISQRRIF
jgi:hypothetical protein